MAVTILKAAEMPLFYKSLSNHQYKNCVYRLKTVSTVFPASDDLPYFSPEYTGLMR